MSDGTRPAGAQAEVAARVPGAASFGLVPPPFAPPLPAPRYVDVGAGRFVRRASCCLLYRVPHEPMCTSCPRRPPAERRILLEGL